MKVKCAHSELVGTHKLTPNPKNANVHPDRQIKLIAKILDYQGWRSPVVVSKRSGFIVKGHGRVEAAKLNGYEEVPVDYQDYENEAQEHADMVADNELQKLSYTDDEAVQELALEMGPDDFDFELFGIYDFKIKGVDTLPPVIDPSDLGGSSDDEDSGMRIVLFFDKGEYEPLIPKIKNKMKETGTEDMKELFKELLEK